MSELEGLPEAFSGRRGDDETTGGEKTGAHLRARGQGGTSLREVERARETLRESGGCCSFEFNRPVLPWRQRRARAPMWSRLITRLERVRS